MPGWLSCLYHRSKRNTDDTKNYETNKSPADSLPAPDGERTPPHTAGEIHVPSPSISSPLHGVGNSITSGNRGLDSTSYGGTGEAPGVDKVVHDNTSGTDLGENYSDKPAPGFSGVTPQNPSQPAVEESTDASVADPTEYAGISLVGKRFRDLNSPA